MSGPGYRPFGPGASSDRPDDQPPRSPWPAEPFPRSPIPPVPSWPAPGSPLPTPRPTGNTRRTIAAVLALVIAALVVVGVVVVASHSEGGRRATSATYTPPTKQQEAEERLRVAMQQAQAQKIARERAVDNFCTSPQPVLDQPANVPGRPELLLYASQPLGAKTLRMSPQVLDTGNYQFDRKHVSLIACMAPATLQATGKTCTYYPTNSPFPGAPSTGPSGGPPDPQALEVESVAVTIYEAHTAKVLGRATIQPLDAGCPDTSSIGAGKVKAQVDDDARAAWFEAHLTGGSFH